MLANLSMSVREAWFLFGLFWAQFIVGAVVPESWHAAELIGVGVVVPRARGCALILRDRRRMPALLRDGFRTPHAELARSMPTSSIAPSDPRAFLGVADG